MEKRKAFTLIELMGVLVIIGILTVILVPVINNTIKNNKQKLHDDQIDMIRLSAQNLATDNTYILPEEDGEEIYITLGQLRAMGYAEGTIIDPLTNKNFPDNLIVMIIKKGNDYDYVINLDGGTIITSSGITVGNPSKKYIREGVNAYYIITAKTASTMEKEQVLENYINIGKENIKLLEVGETDEKVKYKLDGNNGLYKLTVLGGDKNGYLYFSLNNLKDYEGKEVDVSVTNSNIKKIIVDNDPPQISFTTNGTSVWAKSVATKIQVTDNNGNDALDDSTYKYVYSLLNKEEQDLTSTYNLSDEVIKNKDDGEYYLIAKACDKAGNCKTEVSNKFLVDNTPPTCNWSGENTTWTQNAQTITLTGIDNHKMNSSKTIYTKTYNQSDIELSTDNLSSEIEDEAGNVTRCSKAVNVYYDTKKPVITSVDNPTNGNWVNYNFSVKLNTTENGSGLKDVYYSYTSNASWIKENAIINGNVVTTTPFEAERNQVAYFKVCDGADNCSDQNSTQIRIDKTAPTCNWKQNLTWTSSNVTVNVYGTDSGSGMSDQNSKSWTYSGANEEINTAWLAYTIKDNAGNEKDCSGDISVKHDTLAPKITKPYQAGCRNVGQENISFTVEDASPTTFNYKYQYNPKREGCKNIVPKTYELDGGTNTFVEGFQCLSCQIKISEIYAIDAAGNKSTISDTGWLNRTCSK